VVEAGSHVVLERLREQLHLAHLYHHPTGIRDGVIVRDTRGTAPVVCAWGGAGQWDLRHRLSVPPRTHLINDHNGYRLLAVLICCGTGCRDSNGGQC
jgi:hypothetical protein